MSHEKESFFEFLVDDMVSSKGEAAAEGSFEERPRWTERSGRAGEVKDLR
jgi:hypothetical protein